MKKINKPEDITIEDGKLFKFYSVQISDAIRGFMPLELYYGFDAKKAWKNIAVYFCDDTTIFEFDTETEARKWCAEYE